MSDEADRFRKRALECRRLSDEARDAGARAELVQLAAALEEEADSIDAEGDGTKSGSI